MDIEKIREAVKKGHINITDHADEEMEDDNISNKSLYRSVLDGEVIEDYPHDFPLPSCLIFGKDENDIPIHSVWAYNEKEDIAILVTAYIPDSKRWVDYRRRRNK